MAKYEKYLTNKITGETVLIKSNDPLTFQSKMEKKERVWAKQNARLQKQRLQEEAAQQVESLTKEATEEIASYENLLKATLKIDDTVDWEKLKDNASFAAYVPAPKPTLEQFLKQAPRFGFLEIIPYLKNRRLQGEKEAEGSFNKALEEYEKEEKSRLGKYSKEKETFLKKQSDYNNGIESKKSAY